MPLSEQLGLIRISSDELRKILKENGFGYDDLKEIMFPVIKEFVAKGYSITLDMDCGNPVTQRMVKDMEDTYGIVSIWLHINPPETYILEKLRNHPPTWLSANPKDMVANYYRQKETRSKQQMPKQYIYEFDTSRDDLETQCTEVLERIKRSV